MRSLTSPGGSMFPYYYKNGELYGAHYGSFFDDEERLLALLKAEEEFLRKQNRPLPVWIDFYQTKLTDRILTEFLGSINRLQPQITRLAIYGCSFIDRWRIRRFGRKQELHIPVPMKYFDDPEVAKTWLVSERY